MTVRTAEELKTLLVEAYSAYDAGMRELHDLQEQLDDVGNALQDYENEIFKLKIAIAKLKK